jgi:hypothetical protein
MRNALISTHSAINTFTDIRWWSVLASKVFHDVILRRFPTRQNRHSASHASARKWDAKIEGQTGLLSPRLAIRSKLALTLSIGVHFHLPGQKTPANPECTSTRLIMLHPVHQYVTK